MKPLRFIPALAAVVLAAVIAPPVRAESGAEYFAIFISGKKVGHSKFVRQVAGAKVTTSQFMEITITRADVPLTIKQSITSIETAAGKPLGFSVAQDMGTMAMKTEGVVDDIGKAMVTTLVGEYATSRTFDWPAGAVMDEGARLAGLAEGLAEGTSYKVKTFDPASQQVVEMAVLVGLRKKVDLLGRMIELTEVTAALGIDAGQLAVTTYVDEEMSAKKTVMPMLGMTMEIIACDKAFALSKNDVMDFFDKVILPSPIVFARMSKEIIYYLEPLDGRKLSIPTDDNQSVSKSGDTVIVTVCPVVPDVARPSLKQSLIKTSLIKPSKYLQSDDETIIALARQAVGDTKDSATALKKMESFVRDYITKKDLSVGHATAIEVARNRQGDCTEHAVLLAAMCRAAGIPAQVVTGLAHTEKFADRENVFVPHAWVRAHVGEKWIGLDAALDGYDAGHLALAFGDGSPADFFNLVSTLGYFKIARIKTSDHGTNQIKR